MVVVSIIVGILLIAACGMFVAAEFALVTVNKNAVKAQAEQGDKKSKGVLKALATLSTQLSGAQLGITITNLGIGFMAEPAIASLIVGPLENAGLSDIQARSVSVTLALVLATALTMIFGELVPKNLALAKPLEVARAVTGFQRGFSKATAILLRFFNGTANKIVRMFGIEPQEELASARSAEELSFLVRHSAEQGALPTRTAQLVERSFAFGERRAHDAMTPRSRMVSVTQSTPVNELLALAKQTGHSRFPVLEPGARKIDGLVHVRQALAIAYSQRPHTVVGDVMGEATLVPDTVELDDLMDTLRAGGLQMAVLIDESGDVAGVITLEDLVEELVGEVRDEHDPDGGEIEAVSAHQWTVDASVRPDELDDVIDFGIPEHEEYETIAGLVTLELGRLASVGDSVYVTTSGETTTTEPQPDEKGHTSAYLRLMVTEIDGVRIERVLVTLLGSRAATGKGGAR
ncbi:hemolysin family protein [Timonella sp. A28]|uniref:hemolysin family protein n=1 Tax=Timonella sp. A28 TaxID=3442640 RepID=UPI003EB995C6